MLQELTLAGSYGYVKAPASKANRLPNVRDDKSPGESARRSTGYEPVVRAEIVRSASLGDFSADWMSLTQRAQEQNIFMDPEFNRLVAICNPGIDYRTILVWKEVSGKSKLIGVWAFRLSRSAQSLGVSVLRSPAYIHAYLATPVIDRDCLDEALDAMFRAIADQRDLSKIIALDAMEMDNVVMEALARVLAARGNKIAVLRKTLRPKLASKLDGKEYLKGALSKSSRKKLRQHRRRLEGKGVLEFRNIREPDAICRAFGEFIQLEAQGWKGQRHTALLSNPADASFSTKLIKVLARRGDASVQALYLDQRPVSMQIVLRSGSKAFTWKTAYDETLHDVSPGMLLFEDYTAAFLEDKSIALVDSCAYDDTGFMAWTERTAIADLWIDTRQSGSVLFHRFAHLQRTLRSLGRLVKRAHDDGLNRVMLFAWLKSKLSASRSSTIFE